MRNRAQWSSLGSTGTASRRTTFKRYRITIRAQLRGVKFDHGWRRRCTRVACGLAHGGRTGRTVHHRRVSAGWLGATPLHHRAPASPMARPAALGETSAAARGLKWCACQGEEHCGAWWSNALHSGRVGSRSKRGNRHGANVSLTEVLGGYYWVDGAT